MQARAARLAMMLLSLVVITSTNAQVLFVSDNDNIIYNTDTVLNDLLGTGIAFDTYDIATQGAPPTYALMSNYALVIWYCSGDGTNLNFWNVDVQGDLVDYVIDHALWVIGTDVLYAGYGPTPVTFQSGDLPLDIMGIASYDVQSYGDDGGLGCPQMDVAAGLETSFPPTLSWIFSTFWWADGCTPNGDTEVIYRMGPTSYPLFGSASMFHNEIDGLNVMSTLFDPAIIDTYENRVLFLQQTITHMGVSTGIDSHAATNVPTLLVQPNNAECLILSSTEPLRSVTIHNAAGNLVRGMGAGLSTRVEISTTDLCSGMYVVTAVTVSGARLAAKAIVR